MSVSRSEIKSALSNWISDLTKLEVFDKYTSQFFAGTWYDTFEEKKAAYIEIVLKDVGSRGIDRKDFHYNSLNDLNEEIEIRITGQRIFKLEIQIWSFDQNTDYDSESYACIIRDHLWGFKLKEILKNLEIGLGRFTDIRRIETIQNNRFISMCSFDVFFNGTSNSLDHKIGYVGSVELSSNYKKLDGTIDENQFESIIEDN